MCEAMSQLPHAGTWDKYRPVPPACKGLSTLFLRLIAWPSGHVKAVGYAAGWLPRLHAGGQAPDCMHAAAPHGTVGWTSCALHIPLLALAASCCCRKATSSSSSSASTHLEAGASATLAAAAVPGVPAARPPPAAAALCPPVLAGAPPGPKAGVAALVVAGGVSAPSDASLNGSSPAGAALTTTGPPPAAAGGGAAALPLKSSVGPGAALDGPVTWANASDMGSCRLPTRAGRGAAGAAGEGAADAAVG